MSTPESGRNTAKFADDASDSVAPQPDPSGDAAQPASAYLLEDAGVGVTQDGPSPEEPETEAERAKDAAAEALGRAKAAAGAKGLRPGSRPMKRRRRPDEVNYSGSAQSGRDPSLLGDQMSHLFTERGWTVDVAVGSVMGRWGHVVGENIAAHTRPETFLDGELTVRAESSAWATNLRLMTPQVLARLDDELGAGKVTSLRIIGPTAPSWGRGKRRAQGRGPRDTYG